MITFKIKLKNWIFIKSKSKKIFNPKSKTTFLSQVAAIVKALGN